MAVKNKKSVGGRNKKELTINETTMRTKTNLSIEERIAICGVMLLGREVLQQAFCMSHPRTRTTSEQSLKVMQSRWYASQMAQEFRADMQRKLGREAAEGGANLTTREGIIDELVTATRQTTGKDAVSALQTLAKLQGFDKPQEKEGEERRTFFLPYVSRCRNCKLMELFMEVQQKETI